MDAVWRDLRFGIRSLSATPGFTVVAVVMLALGIGVNTTMFSAIDGILLTPLPYEEPDRLAMIRVKIEGRDSLPSIATPELFAIRERVDTFEAVGSIRDVSASLTGDGDPEEVQVGGSTANFLSVLGVKPLLGRIFTEKDGVPGAPNNVVISYGLWHRRFGGNPGIVGKSIELNGTSWAVIGVLPQEMQLLLSREAGLPTDLDAWQAFRFNPANAPWNRWMRGVARLKPGVTYEQAQAAMDNLAAELIREVPDFRTQSFEYEVVPLHGDLVRRVQGPLLILFGAVGFVLLIACANVANLLLARAAAREHEIAVRSAMGASRLRILRQMLTENVLLAVLGGGVGILLAQWAIDLMIRLAPSELPRLDTVALDGRVLGFTLGASMLTVLLFGLVPAWQSSRPDLNTTLKEGLRRGGSDRARLSSFLVVSEIALSLVLLVGAGLLLRSFVHLVEVRPGYNPENITTYFLSLPFQRYRTPEEVSAFYREVTRRLEQKPGIEAAAGIFPLPMTGRFWTNEYAYDERTEEDWGSLESDNHVVLPGYFRSMGTRVLAGRTFTWADNDANLRAVVIDTVLAQKAWPGESPIGKKLEVNILGAKPEWMEVLGVVEHMRQNHPGTDGREQTYLLPVHQPQWAYPMTVRGSLPRKELVAALEEEVHALDPGLPVSRIRSLQSYVDEVLANHRFAMVLLATFAGLAVVMAVVGLFGTIAYSVTQRHHEIGIRVALGATRKDVVRLILGQGLRLTAAGLGVGLAASFALTRVLETLLFGVGALDFPTYGTGTVLLVSVALLACYVPARRASRVEPLVALRYE